VALKVIGAGLGRTGTLSLKMALEQLGFAKCHHMMEVFEHPEHARMFYDAARGKPQWDALFDGYQASVDWPSCHFWRQLMDHYPDAKVILSLRDPEKWYQSFSNTILQGIRMAGQSAGAAPAPPDASAMSGMAAAMAAMAPMMREIIIEQTFDSNLDDKDHIIAVYNAHNERVRETVPPERLLVYEPGAGWEPLCAFLEVPAPDAPYPHTNTTEDFQSRIPQHFRKQG
jgi:hypothetical protein